MAEIPIERKSGVPWWVWLLLVVVLALLAWWLLADNDVDTVDNTVTDTEVVEQMDTVEPLETGEVTTLVALTAAPLTSMVGRDVSLDSVTVGELAGDMAFYIGEGADRIFVAFNEVPTPTTAKEGKYDINPGSVLNLDGKVMSANNVPANISVDIPAGTEAFLFADEIEMVR